MEKLIVAHSENWCPTPHGASSLANWWTHPFASKLAPTIPFHAVGGPPPGRSGFDSALIAARAPLLQNRHRSGDKTGTDRGEGAAPTPQRKSPWGTTSSYVVEGPRSAISPVRIIFSRSRIVRSSSSSSSAAWLDQVDSHSHKPLERRVGHQGHIALMNSSGDMSA